MLPAILQRRDTERRSIAAAEVLRALEPTRQCDIEDPSLGMQNELARPVQAHPHRIRRWTLTECLCKQPAELTDVRSRTFGQFVDAQRMSKVVTHQLDRHGKSRIPVVGGGRDHTEL